MLGCLVQHGNAWGEPMVLTSLAQHHSSAPHVHAATTMKANLTLGRVQVGLFCLEPFILS